MSEGAYEVRLIECQNFLVQADNLLPHLTDNVDIVNVEVLRYELLTFIESYDLKGWPLYDLNVSANRNSFLDFSDFISHWII